MSDHEDRGAPPDPLGGETADLAGNSRREGSTEPRGRDEAGGAQGDGTGVEETPTLTVAPSQNAVAGRQATSPEIVERIARRFPPDILKRYRLGRVLGSGGMGIVLEAEDLRMNRVLAIKGLRSASGPSIRAGERAEREIRITASLPHPNILPVYDMWTDLDGNPWCSMLRVAGDAPTLGRRLEQIQGKTRLEDRPLGELIQAFLQVCRAVAYAHGQGFLHRDLKPDNILLGATGEALVADWGLAIPVAEVREGATYIAGTPGYSAPEQLGLEGTPRSDARSDVYSLGAILFELIAGRRSIAAATELAGSAPEPRSLAELYARPINVPERVPRELAAIIAKAMGRSPADRYSSVPALISDLQTYLNGGVLDGLHYTPGERLRKWVRGHPGFAGVALAALVGAATLLAASVLLLRANRDLQAANLLAESRRRAAQESESKATTARLAAERQALISDIRFRATRSVQIAQSQPEEALLQTIVAASKNLGSGESILPEIRTAVLELVDTAHVGWQRSEVTYVDVAQGADGHSLWALTAQGEIHLLRLPSLQTTRHFRVEAQPGMLAASPLCNLLATACQDQTVRLYDLTGHSVRQPIHPFDSFIGAIAFSPDGKTLAVGSQDGTMVLFDPAGTQTGKPIRAHSKAIRSLAFSPDGRAIATCSLDETIGLWKPDGSPVVPPFSSRTNGGLRQVTFSPDGKMIAGASSGPTIRLWNLEGKPIPSRFQDFGDVAMTVAFSPDGRMLAIGSLRDGTVRLWNTSGKAIGSPMQRHILPVSRVLFTADGMSVVSVSNGDGAIRLSSLAGDELARTALSGHSSGIAAIAFSPDSRWIVSGSIDQTLRLWDLAGRAVGDEFRGHTDSVLAVEFSPDGKTIASGSADSTIRRWSTAGRRIGRPIIGHSGPVTALAYSPDGQILASGSSDKTIRFWDIEGHAVGPPLAGHSGDVDALCFSPDGKLIASGSVDGSIRLWDRSGHMPSSPLVEHGAPVRSLAFSPDGTLLAAGTMDFNVSLWNPAARQLERSFPAGALGSAYVGFTPDGGLLYAGLESGVTRFFDLSGAPVGPELLTGRMVALSPDGLTLASISTGTGASVRLWDMAGHGVGRPSRFEMESTGPRLPTPQIRVEPEKSRLPPPDVLGGWIRQMDATGPEQGTQVAISADGRTVVWGSSRGSVRIRSTDGRSSLRRFEAGSRRIFALAVSPDGKTIAGSLDGEHAERLYLWDTDGRTVAPSIQLHAEAVRALAFSPDGQTIASAGDEGTVRLCDRSGHPIGPPIVEPEVGLGRWTTQVTFRPDGKALATASHGSRVRVWDLRGHILSDTGFGDAKAGAIGFSRSGDSLWIASGNTFQFRDREGRAVEPSFQGNTGGVCSVAVSPDGQTIASSSGDGMIRLWDRSGAAIGHGFHGPSNCRSELAFLDGQMLICAGEDGTLLKLRVGFDEDLDVLCGRLVHHPLMEEDGRKDVVDVRAFVREHAPRARSLIPAAGIAAEP